MIQEIPIFNTTIGTTRTIISRYMPTESYNSMSERRNWKKFGDAEFAGPEDGVKELKQETWILPTITVEVVQAPILEVVGLIKCRNCGGPHLTFKCDKKVVKTDKVELPTITAYRPKINDNFITYKISNLSQDEDVTKEELMTFFSKFGTIKDGFRGISMNRDRGHWRKESGIPYDSLPFLGVAFVKFENRDERHIIESKMEKYGRHRCYNIIEYIVVPNYKLN